MTLERSNSDVSDTPNSVVERAAASGLAAIEDSLQALGAEPVHIFISVHANGVPEWELDCCTAGSGYEDTRELITELLGAAASAGKRLGLTIDVIPYLDGKGGQG